MRLPTAIRAGVLSAILLAGLDRPAGAQVAPLPAPPRPATPVTPAGQPARDQGRRLPPELVGTGVIRGIVVSADTGTPIRKANVNLMPMGPPITTGRGGVPSVGATPLMANGAQMVNVNGSMVTVRPKSVTTDAQGPSRLRRCRRGPTG